MPSNSQDGQQSNLFGPEVVLASPSPSPVKVPEQTTPDTSGPKCAASLASASLQLSLESRLQAALAGRGSPEYRLTWKHWDMPSGVPICALRASGLRISVSASIGVRSGWPTPNAGPQNDTDTQWQARREVCKARHGNNGFGLTLGMASTLAGWPTPTTRDHKDGSYCPNVAINALLGRVVWTAGPLPSGSNALTGKPVAYRLNANFSRWLMGFPEGWANSAPTVMPSSRRSRRSSS